jgi:hypothetical protein
MESYIVRIYRQGPDKTRNIVGVVETVGVDGKDAFTNVDELWGILNPRKSSGQKGESVRTREGRSKKNKKERKK